MSSQEKSSIQSTLSASLFSEPSSAAVSLPKFSSGSSVVSKKSSVVSEKSSVVSEKSSVALEMFSSFSLAGIVDVYKRQEWKSYSQ